MLAVRIPERMRLMMIITIGIDVSKDKLDICISQTKFTTIDNNLNSIKKYFASNLKGSDCIRIVMESTGKYHRLAHKTFSELGCGVMVINPYQSRNFARCMNISCKTDKIDARILCLFAETMKFEPANYMDQKHEEMLELSSRRTQLMQEYIKEKTRLHGAHAQVIESIKKHIKFLEQELKSIEEALKEQTLSDTNLCRKLEILKSVPGVGDVLAQTIITYLPEIGTLSREAVSSLAGLAPMNQDSGNSRGKMRIQKGRSILRRSLYMPTLSAAQSNVQIKKMYNRLIEAGKPAKVALTACMRKLLCILNAMVRENRTWRFE
jgi:transposase